MTVQVVPAPSHVVNCATTCGEEVNVPNSPKTNPETEIALIKVIAISTIVARTGEMPFRFNASLEVATSYISSLKRYSIFLD